MSSRLEGQVAIVTGGSRGIGLAIAQALAREGASVVIASLDPDRGGAAAKSITDGGGQAEFIPTDVRRRDYVARMVDAVRERFGHIDVLVNNAGINHLAPFWEESEEAWERVFRVNVLGTVLPSQAVVRHMKEQRQGSIVHIGSKAGVVGEPGHAAYSASKGAIIALTRAMAVELGPYGIRVNCVCPGPVISDMLLAALPTQAARDQLAAEAPLGRLGQPQDVANAVVYLASSDSAWCTGQALIVDGGLSILK